ncbi:TonB-dependent receptor plug domain-containing protein [Aegicerativicinus sediminis]
MRAFISLILFCFSIVVCGQPSNDTIQLADVNLSTRILKNFSTGQNIINLSDSLNAKRTNSATTYLRFVSPIHFRENGFGMVSSPSFRGTLASHTLVLWNGIPINSQFNGQVDFNTLNLGFYNNIDIRPGGGSLLYGSGGLGGTIHLNQSFLKKNGLETTLISSYGSFNTFRTNASISNRIDNLAYTFNFSHNYSDNDFDIEQFQRNNLNGKYQNYSLNFNATYSFSKSSKVELFNEFYDSNRYLSIIRPSETPGKYSDKNFKSLIQWRLDSDKTAHYVKGSYIREQYKYYQNRLNENFTFGKSDTYFGSYESEIWLPKRMKLKPLISFQNVVGDGTDINSKNFQNAVTALEFKHRLNRIVYELGGRFQWHSVYKGQLLGQFGLEWSAIDNYTLKFSSSKNFRAPTLNDLYWTNSGNLQLKPEDAYQFEITNQYIKGKFKLQFTGFYNDISNLIQWVPRESGLWSPLNVGQAETYGLELNLFYEKDFGDFRFGFNSLNSHTISRDKQLNKFLVYTPRWQSNNNVQLVFKKLSANLQLHLTDKVYTTTDNSNWLNGYTIANCMLEYAFGKKQEIAVGVNIQNIFNQQYQTIELRPMPGRYYQTVIQINL